MKSQAKWMLVVLLSSLILSAFSLLSCARQMEAITIAYSPFESTALLWVAEDQQFFVNNGLNATLRKYDTGAGALDAMIKGEADLVLGTNEFPLVGKAFQQAKIRTVGSVAKSEFIYLVARKDRGIEEVSDLRGKRVGTTFGTIAEFHLGRFLELHGLGMQDITLVDVRTPEEWVNAVADGSIDAIVTAQPYANLARDRLGANAVMLPAQSHQPLFTQAIATNEWIAAHPELVVRFIRSLSQAEEYLIHNPAEAKAIVQKGLNLDAAYMDTVWSQNQFSLSLDQSLILAMEDEARWMIANDLTSETRIPDFLDYLYLDGLQRVKPQAVNIIR